MSVPPWLAVSEHVEVLSGLHAIAWADGVLASAEVKLLARLVRRLGLDPGDEAIRQWLEEPPTTRWAAPQIRGAFDRRFLLSEAMAMAREDGDYTPDERHRIHTWARAWGISDDEIAAMEAEADHEAKGSGDPFR